MKQGLLRLGIMAAGSAVPDTTAPDPPSNLVLTPGNESITAQWDASPSPDVAYYVYDFSDDGGMTWAGESTTTDLLVMPGPVSNYVSYLVRVAAVDGHENRSTWISDTTMPESEVGPPDPPSNLVLNSPSSTVIDATWDESPSVDVDYYETRISDDAGSTWSAWTLVDTNISHQFTGLDPNETYTVEVSVLDLGGQRSTGNPSETSGLYQGLTGSFDIVYTNDGSDGSQINNWGSADWASVGGVLKSTNGQTNWDGCWIADAVAKGPCIIDLECKAASATNGATYLAFGMDNPASGGTNMPKLLVQYDGNVWYERIAMRFADQFNDNRPTQFGHNYTNWTAIRLWMLGGQLIADWDLGNARDPATNRSLQACNYAPADPASVLTLITFGATDWEVRNIVIRELVQS